MRFLTCNVRCFGARDGENHWVHRKGLCAEVIRSQSPDIVCFQEMWAEQFADISCALSDYHSYGMVDTTTGRHPQNCIFYRPDLYTVVSSGGYWLSETPHVAGSKSWESNCVRLANWVRLAERATGNEVRVVNTHLDHISQTARENQARLIVEDSSAYPAEYPQLLTGDMNCGSTNRAIEILKSGGWTDTYGQVNGTETPGHTYHGFLGEDYRCEVGKMDWIFARGALKASSADVIKDSMDGRFPSDHYFVSATVVWAAELKPEDDSQIRRAPALSPR